MSAVSSESNLFFECSISLLRRPSEGSSLVLSTNLGKELGGGGGTWGRNVEKERGGRNVGKERVTSAENVCVGD